MKLLCLAAFLTLQFSTKADAAAQPDPSELTAVEQKTLLNTAEKALKAGDLWHGKICLTNTEVVTDNAADSPARFALMTFYRYDGNMAILLTVELDKMAVAAIATHANRPASLAREEIAEAEKIARANPAIQKALARYNHLDRIEVDTIVAQIINPQVPGYHHRVARLIFRDGQRNYLSGVPMVDVDLTTGEVRFDVIRGLHDKN